MGITTNLLKNTIYYGLVGSCLLMELWGKPYGNVRKDIYGLLDTTIFSRIIPVAHGVVGERKPRMNIDN